MKRNLLKILSVILTMAFVFSFSYMAFAEEETTPETEIIIDEYTTINTTNTVITISGITATCSGRVYAKTSTNLKIKLELQQKKSGVYSTIKTWSTSKANSLSCTLSGSKAVNVLASFRVKATYTAGSETAVLYAYP